jgi:ribosomal protein S18 acetylase RimI-like enzyme
LASAIILIKMEIKLRKAEKADCGRLMELIRELALFEKAPEEVTVSLTEFEEAGFGAQPVWEAFVAEADGEIAGMALFYIRYSTWKGRRIYLEDLIVSERFRGQGIGKMLFERVWAVAGERSYSGMVWQVLDWNEPAIRFYQKYGAEFDSGWLNASLSRNY